MEVEPGGFATFSAEVVKVKQGNPIMSRYGDLRLKGNVPSLDMDKTYSFCGEYVHHEKFGDQYKIIYMNEFQEITDLEEQKSFLRFILTDHQFEMLYEAFENPYEIIKNGDIKSLCTDTFDFRKPFTKFIKIYYCFLVTIFASIVDIAKKCLHLFSIHFLYRLIGVSSKIREIIILHIFHVLSNKVDDDYTINRY